MDEQRTTAGLFLPYVYGRGYPTLNPTLTPAAGTASVLKVPGSRNFRLLSVSGVLTASAVAGNRGVFLEWLDADGNIYCHVPQPIAVAVSTSQRFTFTGQGPGSCCTGDNSLLAPMPEWFAQAGHQIRVGWSSLDAADALSQVFWYYDEMMVGGDGYGPGAATADTPHVRP